MESTKTIAIWPKDISTFARYTNKCQIIIFQNDMFDRLSVFERVVATDSLAQVYYNFYRGYDVWFVFVPQNFVVFGWCRGLHFGSKFTRFQHMWKLEFAKMCDSCRPFPFRKAFWRQIAISRYWSNFKLRTIRVALRNLSKSINP